MSKHNMWPGNKEFQLWYKNKQTGEQKMDIDRKFKIEAVNLKGELFTEKDGVYFKAADPAFLIILREYAAACQQIGCGAEQIIAVEHLLNRVVAYQKKQGNVKIPYVNPGAEFERLIAERLDKKE